MLLLLLSPRAAALVDPNRKLYVSELEARERVNALTGTLCVCVCLCVRCTCEKERMGALCFLAAIWRRLHKNLNFSIAPRADEYVYAVRHTCSGVRYR